MVVSISETARLWEKALGKIKAKLNEERSFDYFFANSYIYEINGKELTLVAPNKVAKPVLQNKYFDLIKYALSEVTDDEYVINIVSDDDLAKSAKSVKVADKEVKKENTYFENATIKPDLTFDNFVVGDFNKEAHKAALYVAKNGGTLFNPLFIYSHSGLGKTHLLFAIGNEIKAHRMPNAKILYITARDFVEEFVKFVRAEKDSVSLKDFFNDVDVLLLDDVQFLKEKVKTEEMFFYIYQDLISRGKRVIITSDTQPNELKGIEERLVTRFTQGLTVKIGEPDVDTCIEILKEKIRNNNLDIEKFDANVLYFIAEKFSRDVRELEGALNSLLFTYTNLEGDQKITMDVAIKAVSSIQGGKHIATQLSEQKIINTVADYYNLTPSQITGKDRNAQFVLARHISMYLIRNNIDVPLKKIGDMFGGKDHTTVMSAITKVDKELKTNKQLQEAIQELEKKIKE